MGQRSIRFPDDLEARIAAQAEALERSYSWIVTRTMEQASKDWSEVVTAVNAGAEIRVEAGSSRAPVEKEPDSPAESAPRETEIAVRGAGAEKAPRSPATVPASSRRAPSIKDTWAR